MPVIKRYTATITTRVDTRNGTATGTRTLRREPDQEVHASVANGMADRYTGPVPPLFVEWPGAIHNDPKATAAALVCAACPSGNIRRLPCGRPYCAELLAGGIPELFHRVATATCPKGHHAHLHDITSSSP